MDVKGLYRKIQEEKQRVFMQAGIANVSRSPSTHVRGPGPGQQPCPLPVTSPAGCARHPFFVERGF